MLIHHEWKFKNPNFYSSHSCSENQLSSVKTYEELQLQIGQHPTPLTLTSIHDDLHCEAQSIQLVSFCLAVDSKSQLLHMLRYLPFLVKKRNSTFMNKVLSNGTRLSVWYQVNWRVHDLQACVSTYHTWICVFFFCLACHTNMFDFSFCFLWLHFPTWFYCVLSFKIKISSINEKSFN